MDDYDTNYETKKLFEDIKKYCETHAYELVFFCRDVEEVYLGKRVNDKDKVLAKVCKLSTVPVIAGGLVSDKEDVMALLQAGVVSISSTNEKIWFL